MPFDCFIFDFDGTLAHSERAYSEAFSHSIRLHTGKEVDQLAVREFWNMTPQEVLRRYGEEILEAMMLSFEDHYYSNHHLHLTLFEGILEVLEHLKERGSQIAIVSLKPRRAGEREMAITGLGSFVHRAIWGDDVERPKPEPDGVLRALKELKAEPHRAIVIGDSPADIIMGRRAGTQTAAALWGGTSRERLMEHAPDHAFDSPRDLLRMMSDQ
jgi:HAD superfamily hydrolase (TIGR01509 family)